MPGTRPILIVGLIALALATGSAQAASVSSNWAGYVAAPRSRVDPGFSSVSGTWTEPSATCTKGHESYSAVWVGLGGASEQARGLEQVGADADCTKAGQPVYSSWFELLPAEAVAVPLSVHPGDRLTASVTVLGSHATLRLRNLSSGGRFTITRRVPRIDVSSAEWIVEAPSVCVGSSPCKAVALTDFKEVAFSAASATVTGHTGPVADPAWTATALELRQGSTQHPPRSAAIGGAPPSNLIVAAPTTAGAEGAFAVRWQEQAVQGDRSTPPALPGANTGGRRYGRVRQTDVIGCRYGLSIVASETSVSLRSPLTHALQVCLCVVPLLGAGTERSAR